VETSEFIAFVRERGLSVIATLGPQGTLQAAVVAVVATDYDDPRRGSSRRFEATFPAITSG
jgi:hypothetical protein